MHPIRILLADDHALVRAGIRALVQRVNEFEVVAEASDGHETLRLAQTCKPDVVLMDVAMPGLSGLDTIPRILRDNPRVAIIILSMHSSREYVRQALQAGAAGYVLKNAAESELETAIRTVARGETYLTPQISEQVATDVAAMTGAAPGNAAESLTRRQREILQLLAEGRAVEEIAEMLHLSTKAVESHQALLMQRLDFHDVDALVRFAIRTGLVSVER